MDCFDTPVQRRGTGCLKWDWVDRRYGGHDLLPMWVADMDFPTAAPIIQAMEKRAAQGIFGYDKLSPAYYDAVAAWLARRHSYPI